MSRPTTILNLLVASLLLVSLVPTAIGTSDPATDAQETLIQTNLDNTGPRGADKIQADWQLRNELQTLYMVPNGEEAVGRLTFNPPSAAASTHELVSGLVGVPDPTCILATMDPTCLVGGAGGGSKVFSLGTTAAESEVSSLSATLFIEATSSSVVTVAYKAGTTTLTTMAIPISGVLVSPPVVGSGPTEYTVSKVFPTPLVVPAGAELTVEISAETSSSGGVDTVTGLLNTVTLYYGSSAERSRIVQSLDAARVAAWVETGATPGAYTNSFPAAASASASDRTLVFRLAHINAMGEAAILANPTGFQVIGPLDKVHYDSEGAIGINAPNGERWGSGGAPTTVTANGLRLVSSRITFPETLPSGEYTFVVNGASWSVEVPIAIGADGGDLSLATGESVAKTILIGQRTTFRLTLRNEAVVGDTFALQPQVGSLQAGWSASVNPPQVTLGPNGATDITLTVTPAPTGANNQFNDVNVLATSLSTGRTFSLDTPVRVTLTNSRTFGVEIVNATANEAPITVPIGPGGVRSVPIIVENRGNGFDTFVVSVTDVPSGWTVSATPALIELDARSQAASLIRFEAASNATGGSTFDIKVKAARVDDAAKNDQQVFRATVVLLDQFDFQVSGGVTGNGVQLFPSTSPTSPLLHVLRDEGPDAAANPNGLWDGDVDADVDFDTSSMFRLLVSNTGDTTDTYTLTPYILTSGAGDAVTLAGGVANRNALGYQDLAGCDGAAATSTDLINDGWLFRMFPAGAAAPAFPASPQSFAVVRDNWDLAVTVPAHSSKLVYIEMKAITPAAAAASACLDASNRVQGTGTGARAADPAAGHAALVEAVSQNDPSHRLTQVVATRINLLDFPNAPGSTSTRLRSQTYSNQASGVQLDNLGGLTNLPVDNAQRTASYTLRATSTANEKDTVRVSVPQYQCASASVVEESCWVRNLQVLDKTLLVANGGTCTDPVASPTTVSRANRIVSFQCRAGSNDDVTLRVTSTAPSDALIGAFDEALVTVASQDANLTVFDDVLVRTDFTGQFALDLVTAAVTQQPIHAGQVTAVPFTLKNLGTSKDNYTVTVTNSVTGWSTAISQANPVFVPPGRSVDLLLLVTAPSNAADGANANFQLNARSINAPGVKPSDNVTLPLTVVAKATNVNVTGLPQELKANPGEAKTGKVKAVHLAGAGTSVRFQVDASTVPAGWSAVLNSSAPQTYKDGVATIDLTVTPPASAVGTSRASIRVFADENPTGTFTLDDWTQVAVSLNTPSLGLDLRTPASKFLVVPGAQTQVSLSVENLGVSLERATFTTVAVPTGWKVAFAAQNVSLQPLQTRNNNVTVIAPVNLTAGTSVLLSFKATTADGLRFDQVDINFTTGRSVLGLLPNIGTTALRQAPEESFKFTVRVNNTGDVPDDAILRTALSSQFKDIVQVTFAPANVTLAPGEAKDVEVTVTLPADLAPNLEVPIVLEAASRGPFLKTVGKATALVKILDYKARDIDGDKALEYAIDRDLNAANGYEQFRDPSTASIKSVGVDPVTFLSAQAKQKFTVLETVNNVTSSVLRFRFDADFDNRTDLLVDTGDADALPDVYWDPDRGFNSTIPVRKDVTKDGTPDYFFDTDGEGNKSRVFYDVFYDPVNGRFGRLIPVDIDNNGALDYVADTNGNSRPDANETVLFGGPDGRIASIREYANVDGKGLEDAVYDTNGDGNPDFFVPAGSNTGRAIVLEDVNGDGVADWTFDSDGDGRRDSYYDPVRKQTAFIDETSDFLDQVKEYWYIGALFGVVLVLFVVLMLVTRK